MKKLNEATANTPRSTKTPITMRTILRALLPPVLGGGAGTGRAAAAGASAMTAPHLLQNFVPSARLAPQELQNAIGHLLDGLDGRVYRRKAGFKVAKWQGGKVQGFKVSRLKPATRSSYGCRSRTSLALAA